MKDPTLIDLVEKSGEPTAWEPSNCQHGLDRRLWIAHRSHGLWQDDEFCEKQVGYLFGLLSGT